MREGLNLYYIPVGDPNNRPIRYVSSDTDEMFACAVKSTSIDGKPIKAVWLLDAQNEQPHWVVSWCGTPPGNLNNLDGDNRYQWGSDVLAV